MKKKLLIIVPVILVILVLVVIGIGLKGCSDSSEETQKPNSEPVEEGVTDWEGDDIVSWDDATEDDEEHDVVDDDSADVSDKDNVKSDTDVTDNNPTDDNYTDDSSSESNPTSGSKPSDDKVTDTKKQYTITYILNNENATIETTTQTVTYGETFTLATPEIVAGDDFRFVKWIITGTTTEFKSGIYTIEGDVSLTAVWEDTYSKNY